MQECQTEIYYNILDGATCFMEFFEYPEPFEMKTHKELLFIQRCSGLVVVERVGLDCHCYKHMEASGYHEQPVALSR